jgi:hypothetical protein
LVLGAREANRAGLEPSAARLECLGVQARRCQTQPADAEAIGRREPPRQEAAHERRGLDLLAREVRVDAPGRDVVAERAPQLGTLDGERCQVEVHATRCPRGIECSAIARGDRRHVEARHPEARRGELAVNEDTLRGGLDRGAALRALGADFDPRIGREREPGDGDRRPDGGSLARVGAPGHRGLGQLGAPRRLPRKAGERRREREIGRDLWQRGAERPVGELHVAGRHQGIAHRQASLRGERVLGGDGDLRDERERAVAQRREPASGQPVRERPERAPALEREAQAFPVRMRLDTDRERRAAASAEPQLARGASAGLAEREVELRRRPVLPRPAADEGEVQQHRVAQKAHDPPPQLGDGLAAPPGVGDGDRGTRDHDLDGGSLSPGDDRQRAGGLDLLRDHVRGPPPLARQPDAPHHHPARIERGHALDPYLARQRPGQGRSEHACRSPLVGQDEGDDRGQRRERHERARRERDESAMSSDPGHHRHDGLDVAAPPGHAAGGRGPSGSRPTPPSPGGRVLIRGRRADISRTWEARGPARPGS